MKVLLLATTVIIVLGTGIAVLSGLIGETSRGRTLAQALGIPRPAVITHRGASYLAPEETRPAFLMARELGVCESLGRLVCPMHRMWPAG